MADTDPKLHFVRVYLGEQRMDVGLFDPILKGPRLIQYKWHAKDGGNAPPKDWYKAVFGEVQFQRSQELKAKTGRLIPTE
jgi:hypothetical protein